MWHHAQFRNEELIILGYSPAYNDCMLVRLSGLPMNEQQELRRIAASRVSQETPYLMDIIKHMESPWGVRWWDHLAMKMTQRNSPVFKLPLKEIQDTIDPDQRAIFKGYGKNRTNTRLEADLEARGYGADSVEQDAEEPRTINNTRETPPVFGNRGNDIGYKIDLLMETLVDENRRTQELLGKLLGALAGEPEPEPVKAAPKPRKQRVPPKAKTGSQEVHAQ